jgi:hypothetical protein
MWDQRDVHTADVVLMHTDFTSTCVTQVWAVVVLSMLGVVGVLRVLGVFFVLGVLAVSVCSVRRCPW